MGLTFQATGRNINEHENNRSAIHCGRVIALAGNPNVGKSTVFNYLTGMHQHTGNWPGKTVGAAYGEFEHQNKSYTLIDIPGTYSLMPHSEEEMIARDYLCLGEPDAVIVVCDGSSLEHNLSLVLQAAEITDRLAVCVNLMDEAENKGINVDAEKLSNLLGVPVVLAAAGNGRGMTELKNVVAELCSGKIFKPCRVKYSSIIELMIDELEAAVSDLLKRSYLNQKIKSRWLSLRILEHDTDLLDKIQKQYDLAVMSDDKIKAICQQHDQKLKDIGIKREDLIANMVSCQILNSESIYEECVTLNSQGEHRRELDRRLDKIFTGRFSGALCMIALLAGVFWLTIVGANYPSEWLSSLFSSGEIKLRLFFEHINMPNAVTSLLLDGVYCVMTWIISVMLPPMAIFFPLFTLLEDSGYLPRVAFNLDDKFRRCDACGKQALTTCMGFGCNAVGVTGCRIIDSPRERLIAMLTNSFVPCNGRYPMLTAIISIFFLGSIIAPFDSILSALILTAVIMIGLGFTFAVSKLLSKTILKGMPSSFALELPPYRKPKIMSVIVRSIFDRTLFVLGRAISVAAPAGIIIWLTANIHIGGESLLAICDNALEPFARLLGLDGVILMAFILGFPANEIVIPLIIMSYMSAGRPVELNDLSSLGILLTNNGWTLNTAICTIIFSMIHWPCSTTCITIYKETKSLKWTAAAILIPTIIGMLCCIAITAVFKLAALI